MDETGGTMTTTKRVTRHRTPRPRRPEQREKARVTVADVMATDVVTVNDEQSLRDIADLFSARHISGAPVTSASRLVGVISIGDILAFEAGTPGAPREDTGQTVDGEPGTVEEWEEGLEPPAAFFTEMWADVGADVTERFVELKGPEWDVLAEHTVGEAMTPRVFAVAPNASLAKAAAEMLRAGVHRLLVTDKGKLMGIVTTTDIVRAVAGKKL
jgi:CBS domain-containing protein